VTRAADRVPGVFRVHASLLIVALAASIARGDVTTTLSGSSLVVIGDTSSDSVSIEGVADGVTVAGLEGTLVNDSSQAVTVSGVEKLTVKLGDGADRLRLMHLTLPHGLVVRLGRGNDSVELDQVSTGTASIRSGYGNDAVFIYGPSTFDLLSVQTSRGNDLVVVSGVWVRGNLGVDTGSDSDQVNIIATQVGSNLYVHLGNDDDFAVLQDITVYGDTDLDGGNGDDVLVFAGYVWFGDDPDIDGFGDNWWWW